MNNKEYACLLIAVFIFFSNAAKVQTQPKANKHMVFEYKAIDAIDVLKLSGDGTDQDMGLNSLGKDGWELINVVEINGKGWFFFKKQKE
jgi:hypothetical protein